MPRPSAALLALCVALVGGCQCGASHPPAQRDAGEGGPKPNRITISVVGTNDLHGHIEALPILAGYLDNLRAARADHGGVLLIDAGDMFQGTLESNLVEGASIVKAYEAMRYAAVAIGNHEFDFGPVGPSPIPKKPGDDPRGALRARAAEADYPFLTANVLDAATGKIPDWDNVEGTMTTEVAGVKIGVIGVTTLSTPQTTIAYNFEGLRMRPLAEAITEEATRLRTAGAVVIVVAAHAGGHCSDFHDPHQRDSCDADAEIFQVARQLRTGLVDVIVAGHTHAGVAHRINGIAVIESYAYGRAFGRVDLLIRDNAIKESVIFPPRFICGPEWRPGGDEKCAPGTYERKGVRADPEVAAIAERAAKKAEAERERSLNVELSAPVKRAYREESPLGNLFTDLMRQARPRADVALTNGGGLRDDLPEGPLTYGELYRAFPFDNRFAFVTLTADQLAEAIAANLRSKYGVFSVSGVEVRARCSGSRLRVELLDSAGRRIPGNKTLVVATSDFLATGGDGVFGHLELPKSAVEIESGEPIRDVLAGALEKRGGKIDPEDLFDPAKRRLVYPGARPVHCGD